MKLFQRSRCTTVGRLHYEEAIVLLVMIACWVAFGHSRSKSCDQSSERLSFAAILVCALEQGVGLRM